MIVCENSGSRATTWKLRWELGIDSAKTTRHTDDFCASVITFRRLTFYFGRSRRVSECFGGKGWSEGGAAGVSFAITKHKKKLPIRFYCIPRYLVMGGCSGLGVTHWISQKCSRMTATGIVSNYCVQRRYILPRCRTNRLKYSFVPAATGLLNRCLIDESVCSFQCCLLCCVLLLLCGCGWLFCVTAGCETICPLGIIESPWTLKLELVDRGQPTLGSCAKQCVV